jgi:hypothetical protein
MKRVRAQQGSALLIITILVVVLAGLAGAFLTTTWVEHQATMHTEEEVQCRQAAAAGLDRARRLLFEIRDRDRTATWDDALMVTEPLARMSGYLVPPSIDGRTTTTTTTIESPTITNPEIYQPTSSNNPYQYNVVSYPPMPGTTKTAIPPEAFFGQNFVQGDVVYNAILADDNDGDGLPTVDANDQVVVYVTVASPAEPQPGQIRKILGVYRSAVYYIPPEYVPNYAIVVNGNLHMGGSVKVTGLLGSVHANGDLVVEGGTNMIIGQQGSATGNVVILPDPENPTSEPPTPTEGWKSNAKTVPIPEINPAEHIDKAAFVLEKDGNVYDNTVVPRKLIATGTWFGFSFNKVTLGWDKTGAEVTPPGAIYINGSTKITAGGTAADPWKTTLLVNGSIDISGNPYITPSLLGVTMLARGDIDITGAPKTFPTVAGLIATHEQVNIGGTAAFEGSVLAEDAEDLYRDVTTISELTSTGIVLEDMTKVIGNFALHFDGNLETFLIAGGSSVAIRSWDRFR